jgi:hypothetical protein
MPGLLLVMYRIEQRELRMRKCQGLKTISEHIRPNNRPWDSIYGLFECSNLGITSYKLHGRGITPKWNCICFAALDVSL